MSKLDGAVIHGWAKLVEHEDGGWALPGGGRTENRQFAEAQVRRMSKLVGDDYRDGDNKIQKQA